MILVFDMDDTLYDEATYVQSGLKAVAQWLASTLNQSADHLHLEMTQILNCLGRGRVFDTLLQRHARSSRKLVDECVRCYRKHAPAIRLHEAGRDCLRRFRKLPLYVVTDGNKTAQSAKARALGLEKIVRKVFITHRYGVQHAKPSAHCFQIIQQLEKTPPQNIVYIGDNPAKDFVGINPLGFRTIRVLTGPNATAVARPGFDAQITIRTLNELTHDLLQSSEFVE